jgi:hypothetical protein
MAWLGGHTKEAVETFFNEAWARHPGNRWAIHNSLLKHHDLTDGEAWYIVSTFMDETTGTRIEDRRSSAFMLAKGRTAETSEQKKADPRYIVTSLDGSYSINGSDARMFMSQADALDIPRESYRVYEEISYNV